MLHRGLSRAEIPERRAATHRVEGDTTPPAHYNYDETTVTVGNNFWSGPHGVDNGMGRLTSWYVGTSEPGLAMKTYT
jgi:hypothetical protein